ncbi:MAG: 2Fe-2S iron-sulfur cluster-binding protein, partial [Chloroherpetonaceae bacterium]|nr:2Fe-2S iron-sulfur cluster-binding protein [Chloroherpetonaceae bacterium]MDW8020704.1 2Fe-2S iron-sulfur cluster-binding protein [Chloroherpetonaceae bacterium]
VMLTSACYGHALCAGCLVAVESGNENLSSMKKTEREAIRAHGYPERDEHGHILRLACQTRVFGKVVVHSYPPRGNSVV